jgi:hypothetical protein
MKCPWCENDIDEYPEYEIETYDGETWHSICVKAMKRQNVIRESIEKDYDPQGKKGE